MRRRASCRQSSSSGPKYPTRSASSISCAKRRDQPMRPTGKSRRRCANSCAPSVKELRKQVKGQLPQASAAEAEQLAVLDDYALGVLTALNRDGTLPFEYPAVRAGEDLDEVEASLERLGKKGQR